MNINKKNNIFFKILFLLLTITMFISCPDGWDLEGNKPSTPSNVKATIAPDNYEIIIVWEGINEAGITYNLYYDVSVDREIIKSNVEENVSSPFYHDYDLIVGNIYCYKLVSVKEERKSFFSDPVCIKFTSPDPPDNIQLRSGNKEITISWRNISGLIYDIYMDTTAEVSKNSFYKTRRNITNPYTWTNLVNDIKYYFILTAINGCGESDESSLVSGTPRPPYELSKPTLSSGSVQSYSKNFRQKGVIGQSTPVGFSQSASFKNKSGSISISW